MLEPLQTGRVYNVHPINQTDTANMQIRILTLSLQMYSRTSMNTKDYLLSLGKL